MTDESRPQSFTSDPVAYVRSMSRKRIALYAALTVAVLFYLSPLYTGMTTALKTAEGFRLTSPYAPPFGYITFEPWVEAWELLQGESGAMVNSMLFTIPATLISAFFGSITAYGLTKIDWRGQLAVLVMIVAGVFIPYQSVLVPLTRFWTIVDLGSLVAGVPLLASKVELVELMITHSAYGIPICTVLFRGYYLSISDDIVEAARIDGANFVTIYRQIILPLSVPMFVVTLIFQFTNIWNDFLFALVLVNEPTAFPVTLALNELQGAFTNAFNLQMASAFLAALPTLIVYIFFGDKFAEGVAGGQG